MKIINYGNLTFNKIYGKFQLTEKYFSDTQAKYGYYEYMAKEWKDLMSFDDFFIQTVENNSVTWFCVIRLHLPNERKSKRYPFMIVFSQVTGMLSHINIYDLPQSNNKKSKERRKLIINAVRKEVGYFIAVMMHHNYINHTK